MKNKKKLFLFFILVICHSFTAQAQKDFLTEAENNFQKIGARWMAIELEAQSQGSAPEWLAMRLKKIREEFKIFADSHSDSRWADDALYFAAIMENSREKSLHLKLQIIQLYPEAKIENWTAESLPFALPEIEPLDAAIRMDICFEYLKSGRIKELEALALESAEKYPELGTQFDIISSPTTQPKDSL